MTLDIYADLFDEDLDGVADRLDLAIRSTADPTADWCLSDQVISYRQDEHLSWHFFWWS